MPEHDYEGIRRTQIPWDPRIDTTKCVTCGKCVEFCHMRAFKLEEKDGKKHVTVKPNRCVVFCRGCEDICPQRAITHPSEEVTRALIDRLKGRKIR